MLRSIGWMTLVLALAVVAHIYQQQSFDQNARNLAATSERRTEVLERSLQTMDDTKLEDIRDLTRRRIPAQRVGEHPATR